MNKKFKILWVEDEAGKIFSIVRPLIKDGHEIIIAENEEEALQKIQNNNFDLIILDLIIPTGEKDSVKFIEYVGMHLLEITFKKLTQKIPIIVLSVVSDPAIITTAKEMGVEKFLIKGTILPSEFKREVYQTLGLSQ